MGRDAFGRKIAELRRQKELSLRGLARMVGMDFSWLSKIEHGDRPPPEPKYIARLARHLGVDVFELAELAEVSKEFLKALATSPKAQAYFAKVAGPTNQFPYRFKTVRAKSSVASGRTRRASIWASGRKRIIRG